MPEKLIEPTLEQVLEFCARDPIERVFLEDVARRGFGRFVARRGRRGSLVSLCHLGANLVPSGDGCGVFADVAAASASKMIIGNEQAVGELWREARHRMPEPRADRPGQPVYAIAEPPEPGDTGLRAATLDDLELLVPVCAAAHEFELGVDPLERDAEGFRWRTRAQIADGRSWLWVEDDVVLFKAEASAWTPPRCRSSRCGSTRRCAAAATARAGCATSAACCSTTTPFVTLFVRTENAAAIALYESIGMRPRRPLPLAALLTVRRRSSRGTARACSTCAALLNGDTSVPGGLTPAGVEQARALGVGCATSRSTSCVTSEFERAIETADVALGGRERAAARPARAQRPAATGPTRAGLLEDYRAWAMPSPSSAVPGDGGESRVRDRRAVRAGLPRAARASGGDDPRRRPLAAARLRARRAGRGRAGRARSRSSSTRRRTRFGADELEEVVAVARALARGPDVLMHTSADERRSSGSRRTSAATG